MKRISLILALILIASCLGCALPGIAFAASETIYSDVLEDLGKDETFDAAQYPEKDEDKMDVIQVAESNAGELFLYVYQPQADKYTASEARISTSIGDNLSPKDYKLTLLSRNGTLSKYIVNDFTVLPDVVRYYVIIQLARPWDNDVDGKPSGNEAKTVPYPIGKQFTACTIDGNVTYTEAHEEVITITDKYVGYLRYLNGFWFFKSSCDSHFVAFDTDRQIDKLMEADITYSYQTCYEQKPLGIVKLGELKENSITLYDTDEAGNKISAFGVQHTWKRIEKVEEFISKEELNDEDKQNIRNKKWVLRFCETNVTEFHGSMYKDIDSTKVTEVTILRLKFETNDIQYNLGVIDNKQNGSGKPSNPAEDAVAGLETAIKRVTDFFNFVGDLFQRFAAWCSKYWWVFLIIGVVIALAIAAAICKPIAKVLWYILKGLFYVVTSPYWIIRAIVLAAKKRKQ